jgi:hypothetical protein
MTKSRLWYIISGILTCVLFAVEYYYGYYLAVQKAVDEHKHFGIYSDAFARLQSMEIAGGVFLLIIVTIPLLYCIWVMPQDMIEQQNEQRKIRKVHDYFKTVTGMDFPK